MTRSNKVATLVLTLLSANADVHAHGDHDHHHGHHHSHLRDGRALSPVAPPGLCKDGDPTFTIGGNTYACQAEFNEAGGNCRTPDASPEAKGKADQDFKQWKENKKNNKGGIGPKNEDVRHRALEGCPNSDCVDWDNQVITIPVHFHVFHNGNDGRHYTWEENPGYIIESIKVMNKGFRGQESTLSQDPSRSYQRYLESDIDTKVQFCLAGTTSTDDRKMYNDRGSYKANFKPGGMETLNVWVNTAQGYLGYATFPQENDPEDGVVILNESMPGKDPDTQNPEGDIYGFGDTLTHEVGHWLGLYHTHQGGCSGDGDYMDDAPLSPNYASETSNESTATYDCEQYLNNCNNDYSYNPIHNFMSYTNDECMDEFTPGQKLRIQQSWETYRHVPNYSEHFSLNANGYECDYTGPPPPPAPTPQPTGKPTGTGGNCPVCGNNEICCASDGVCETSGKPADRACV